MTDMPVSATDPGSARREWDGGTPKPNPTEDAGYYAAWDAWAAAVRSGAPREEVAALWSEVNATLDRLQAAQRRLLAAVEREIPAATDPGSAPMAPTDRPIPASPEGPAGKCPRCRYGAHEVPCDRCGGSPEGPDEGLREQVGATIADWFSDDARHFTGLVDALMRLPLLTAERERAKIAEAECAALRGWHADGCLQAMSQAQDIEAERDALQRQVDAVRALCDEAEVNRKGHGFRWWINTFRAALSRTATERLPYADVSGLTPETCPQRGNHGNPFRYCPVKGCGWHEGMER